MNYLASAPFAWNRMRSEALGGEAVQGFHHFVITGSISADKIVSFFGCHRCCPYSIVEGARDSIADLFWSTPPHSKGDAKGPSDTLRLNTKPFLLYYPREPNCAVTPWCLPSESLLSVFISTN